MRGNYIALKEFDGQWFNYSDGQIPDNGFRELRNVYVTSRKTLRTRSSIKRITMASGTNAYQGGNFLGIWHSATEDKFILDHAGGLTHFNKLNHATLASVNRATLMLEALDKAWLFDTSSSSTPIRTLSGPGTYTTTPVTNVQASVGVVHKNRMFVCNNILTSVVSSQLRYSEIFGIDPLLNPDTVAGWPTNNTIDIGSSDKDFIVSVVVMNDTLFVFKRFSTWMVYVEGSPPWTVRKIHPSIGCIGRNTAIAIGGLIYFRSALGVYRTDGTNFELISQPNKEIFDDVPVFNQTACNNRNAIWLGDLYILNDKTPNGYDYSNRLEVYNLESNAWSYWDTGVGNISTMLVDPSESPPFFYVMGWNLNSATGRLHAYTELYSGDDGDSTDIFPITAGIKSKEHDFDKPGEFKFIRQVQFDVSDLTAVATPGVPTISMTQFNEKAQLNVMAVINETPSNDTTRKLYRWRGPFRCRTHRFEASWVSTANIEINQIIYDMAVRGSVGEAR